MLTDIRTLIATRRDEKKDEGGFTLIELLIVIVVLGILAAIVVFAVQNLTKDSATSACRSDAKTVEVGVEAFKAQVGSYPVAPGPMLTATTLVAGGNEVGPWIRSFPQPNDHYIVSLGTNLLAVGAAGGPTNPPGGGAATAFEDGKVLIAKANAPTTFFDINAVPAACEDLP